MLIPNARANICVLNLRDRCANFHHPIRFNANLIVKRDLTRITTILNQKTKHNQFFSIFKIQF